MPYSYAVKLLILAPLKKLTHGLLGPDTKSQIRPSPHANKLKAQSRRQNSLTAAITAASHRENLYKTTIFYNARVLAHPGRKPFFRSVTLSFMIETPRLLLQEVQLSDAPHFHAYMTTEEYLKFLPLQAPTLEVIQRQIHHWMDDVKSERRMRFFLTARLKGSPDIVGEAILRVTDPSGGEAEIGWGLHPDHFGKGLATEIGAALLDFGFSKLRLHRIYARCHPQHKSSIRIMEKIGMTQEGLIREHYFVRDQWWSSHQSSILAREYKPMVPQAA